jgi:hypothetical protein
VRPEGTRHGVKSAAQGSKASACAVIEERTDNDRVGPGPVCIIRTHRNLVPLVSGTRLGPCEILSPLGAGGMGEVYKAREPRSV